MCLLLLLAEPPLRLHELQVDVRPGIGKFMRMPDFFYSCHPKQALAGVGQPGRRAGVSAAWHMHGMRSVPELCPCCAGAVSEPIRQSGASGRARYGMGGGRAGRPEQLLLG